LRWHVEEIASSACRCVSPLRMEVHSEIPVTGLLQCSISESRAASLPDGDFCSAFNLSLLSR
jgi:hypothetical protein